MQKASSKKDQAKKKKEIMKAKSKIKKRKNMIVRASFLEVGFEQKLDFGHNMCSVLYESPFMINRGGTLSCM